MAGFHLPIVFLTLGMLLSACTTPPAPPAALEITFQHRDPIALNVAAIEFVDRHVPSKRAPNVEHLHRDTPSGLAARWVKDRLRAAGSGGHLTLFVEKGDVWEEALKVETGFTGLFTDNLQTRLHARLKTRLEYVGDVGGTQQAYTVTAEAKAEQEVLESATMNERDLAYLQTLEALAAEFDKIMEAEIRRALAPALR